MHLKLTNGTPAKYTLGQLRRDNPQTSFPKQIPDEMLASYDVYPYTRPIAPEYDYLSSKVVDGGFEQDTVGNWSLPYVVEQQPQDQAERNIRSRRDNLLQETDWIVIKSYERGANIPAEWELYRQALRDITSQAGFPYSVEWPTKP
ncbi:phage tail assembly chaperone [Planktomarina temperata]|nr:phage tail assembly chaperone [Planktomarina temperata]